MVGGRCRCSSTRRWLSPRLVNGYYPTPTEQPISVPPVGMRDALTVNTSTVRNISTISYKQLSSTPLHLRASMSPIPTCGHARIHASAPRYLARPHAPIPRLYASIPPRLHASMPQYLHAYTWAYTCDPTCLHTSITLCLFAPLPTPRPRKISVSPLTLARWPPECAANNCGHPAKLSGPCLGAYPLRLAGCPLITRLGSWKG